MNLYADDTNLLVPENTNCTLSGEFDHIKDWAKGNKMSKTTSTRSMCRWLLMTLSKLKSLGFLVSCYQAI